MELKTPYFLIDQKEIDFGLNKMISALDHSWSNYIIGYSYKTNSLPWIIRHFDRCGCYAEVVSGDEYRLAEKIGVKKGKIIYNGPVKTKKTFQNALRDGCYVNIDSRRELDWLFEMPSAEYRVGIRVNFDLEKRAPGHSQTQNEGGRFGFCYENGELGNVISQMREHSVAVSGLHLHTGSVTRGLEVYRAIAEVACEIKKKYDLNLSYVDIGGGFFGGLPDKPQFDDYFALVSGILKKEFLPDKTTLIVEPGMSLIGPCVQYVSSVIDVKDTEYHRFVTMDGSRTNIDPLMKKKNYSYTCERNENGKKIPSQVICGFTCMENDRFFEMQNESEIQVGDRICFDKVGAYTMCLTPLFIQYFPDVYVKDAHMIRKVREAWTEKEYLQNSIDEEMK